MITVDCGYVETCGNKETIDSDIETLITYFSTSCLREMQHKLIKELVKRERETYAKNNFSN